MYFGTPSFRHLKYLGATMVALLSVLLCYSAYKMIVDPEWIRVIIIALVVYSLRRNWKSFLEMRSWQQKYGPNA